MPLYRIRQYRDAWQTYVAHVECETPQEAMTKAKYDDVVWQRGSVEQFDDRHFEVFEITQDKDNFEVESDVILTTFP